MQYQKIPKQFFTDNRINIELRRNWLGVMFGTLFYMTQRPGYKKIGTKVFEELWNVVLKENGEDNMVRESN